MKDLQSDTVSVRRPRAIERVQLNTDDSYSTIGMTRICRGRGNMTKKGWHRLCWSHSQIFRFHTVKLQSRAADIIKAHAMVQDVDGIYAELRDIVEKRHLLAITRKHEKWPLMLVSNQADGRLRVNSITAAMSQLRIQKNTTGVTSA